MEEYEIQNMYKLKKKCSLRINNVIVHKNPRVRDKKVYTIINVYVENIGSSIAEIYKVVITVNYHQLNLSFEPHQNIPSYMMLNQNLGQITFKNNAPIFPNEILSIGEFTFGVDRQDWENLVENGEFNFKLHFQGGIDEITLPFKEMIKFEDDGESENDDEGETESE